MALRNPFTSRDEEIARLRAELADIRDEARCTEFTKLFAEALAVQIAYMPRAQWPDVAVRAYEHAQGKVPTAARIWRDRHENANGAWGKQAGKQ